MSIELIPEQRFELDGRQVVVRAFTDDDLRRFRAALGHDYDDRRRQATLLRLLIREPIDVDNEMLNRIGDAWLERIRPLWATLDLGGPVH